MTGPNGLIWLYQSDTGVCAIDWGQVNFPPIVNAGIPIGIFNRPPLRRDRERADGVDRMTYANIVEGICRFRRRHSFIFRRRNRSRAHILSRSDCHCGDSFILRARIFFSKF
jgi:hypothetical protein